MKPTHPRYTRGLLAGTAVAMFAAFVGSTASASELPAQNSVVNRQHLQQAGEDGSAKSTAATTDGSYGVHTGGSSAIESALTITGNSQSAEVAGNAASSTLTARTVRAEGGGSYETTPFADLTNRQTGDGAVKATSRMTVAAPGEIGGSSITLSDNANTALAQMNDATNGVAVEAATIAGETRLSSGQHATGSVTASATSRIVGGNASAPIPASRYAIEDNSTASEATANRALNSLSATAATIDGGRTVLDNRQHNGAEVLATTKTVLNVKGSGAYESAISIDGNAASSLARGNVAENKMTLSGGAGTGDYPGGGETPMLIRAAFVPVSTGAVLANRQVNDGGVAAKTITGAGVALNCGCTDDSRIGVTGNTGAASAYGNAALNSATVEGVGQPLALVSNVQANRGPVTASAIGRFGAAMTGGTNASLVTVSGNSLAATAIGNQAVNAITISR